MATKRGNAARARTERRLRRLLLLGLVLVLLADLVFPLRTWGTAAATFADAAGLPVVRPFAADVSRETTRLGGIRGDLYSPGGPAPPVLFVPGAAPAGRGDRRVERAATAIAGAERLVFVPELDLYDEELVVEDVDRLVRAGRGLHRHEDARGTLVVFGVSYGGSIGFLAAADEGLAPLVAQVAMFGSYFDLVGVIEAATTGASMVAGEAVPWDGDPRAEEVVRDAAVDLAPPAQRGMLSHVLEGRGDPSRLPAEAAALHDVLINEDPRRTAELVRRLPEETRRRFDALSPVEVASQVEAEVVAMHATGDPAVPYAELMRLRRHLPDGRYASVAHFDHVDLELPSLRDVPVALVDAWAGWRFATWVLVAHDESS